MRARRSRFLFHMQPHPLEYLAETSLTTKVSQTQVDGEERQIDVPAGIGLLDRGQRPLNIGNACVDHGGQRVRRR